MLTRAAARRRAAEAQAEAYAAETQAASLLPGAFLGGRPDGGAAPLLERGERLQEPVWDDPEEPRSKRRRRGFSWFPSARVTAGKGGGVRVWQQQKGGGGKKKEAVAGAEAREAEERVLGRPATRRAYMSKDGTPLVWDAPTLLELRAGQHMLTRAVGAGSIRVSVLHKAVPCALLPSALALAVENGFLSMGEAAPKADTDWFDKGALNAEQIQMMAEERTMRKLMRAERLEKQRAQEEAAAAAAAAAEAEAGTTAAAKAEAQQEEGMDVDVDVHGCGVSAPMVVEEGDGGAVAAGAAAGATGDGVGMASAAPAAATVDAPKPEPGPAEEARARYEGALAAAMQGPELQGDDEEEQQQAKIPPADLSLVRPLESLRDYHSPEEARLRAVYRDLWERGLTVGCGSPYGADFTAYEGDPLAFHSFAAIIVKDARVPLSARELSAAVRLEQSVVKLLVYALCHEMPPDASPSPPSSSAAATANNDDGTAHQCGTQKLKGQARLLPPWAAPSSAAATTRFGPPRSRVGRFLIEYVTMRFISVTRRME